LVIGWRKAEADSIMQASSLGMKSGFPPGMCCD
jgi:hypothetical protein